jgi:dynein intermediate chain 1, axonemal
MNDVVQATGQDHIYLVGTEEGAIHKCSKAYSSEVLSSYQGHHMSVYSVKWNYIHTRMFLSASADWTINLWDSNITDKPIMSFNLGATVGDIAWAPYSATVFAAVTDDGRVCVYDLHQNKLTPLCTQKVVRKAKLTKIVFNPRHPIVLVGDDRGCVTSLKLSPNLRQTSKPVEKGQNFTDMECSKLDRVIEVAKKSQVSED